MVVVMHAFHLSHYAHLTTSEYFENTQAVAVEVRLTHG